MTEFAYIGATRTLENVKEEYFREKPELIHSLVLTNVLL